MPFEVKVEADKLLAQFDELQKRIAGLEQDVPKTFADWQTEDMHRKTAHVLGSGYDVYTMIYPRSKFPSKGRTGGKAAKNQRRARVAVKRSGAHRPILRPELYDKLRERMIKMCEEAMKWQ